MVKTAAELRGVASSDSKLLGIFKTAVTGLHASGVRAASTPSSRFS